MASTASPNPIQSRSGGRPEPSYPIPRLAVKGTPGRVPNLASGAEGSAQAPRTITGFSCPLWSWRAACRGKRGGQPVSSPASLDQFPGAGNNRAPATCGPAFTSRPGAPVGSNAPPSFPSPRKRSLRISHTPEGGRAGVAFNGWPGAPFPSAALTPPRPTRRPPQGDESSPVPLGSSLNTTTVPTFHRLRLDSESNGAKANDRRSQGD